MAKPLANPAAGPDAEQACDDPMAHCNMPCAEVEIEINDTPGTKDDLVQVRSEHPPDRPTVDCQIRAVTYPPSTSTIVLTNPDGRLRFGAADAKTLSVPVPNDGSWVPFQISGEKGSKDIGDAVIEAHCNTAAGPLMGKKAATVFWFEGEIKLVPGKHPGQWIYGKTSATCAGSKEGPTIAHQAKVELRPPGVDASAPQVSKLRVGIVQNQEAGLMLTMTWTASPVANWHAGVPVGTKVKVPRQLRDSRRAPLRSIDADEASPLLYDMSPKALVPIGSVAESNDNPSQEAPLNNPQPGKDDSGTVLAEVDSGLSEIQIHSIFIAYAVVYNTENKKVNAIRQRKWGLNVYADLATRKIPLNAWADPSDGPIVDEPVTSGTFAADMAKDPANIQVAPVNPTDQVELVRPALGSGF